MARLSRPFKRSQQSRSTSLEQLLTQYSISVSAAGVSLMALASSAQAKIVYTPTHIKITPNHKLFLDLNHDGIHDFRLNDDGKLGSSDFLFIYPLQKGNAFVVAKTDCAGTTGAAAIRAGAVIGERKQFTSYGCMAQHLAADSSVSLGSWAGGVKNRFLGLRFMIKGKKHFGWARFTVTKAPYTVVLNGYAYETTSGKAILAGATLDPQDAGPTASFNRYTPEPLTLGRLALGAPGLSVWRREESMAASS